MEGEGAVVATAMQAFHHRSRREGVREERSSALISHHLLLPPSLPPPVGHSLGAALAVLCTMDLLSLSYPVQQIISFGQPRVGNKEVREGGKGGGSGGQFRPPKSPAHYSRLLSLPPSVLSSPPSLQLSSFFASQTLVNSVSFYRLVHHRDPVPHLPPQCTCGEGGREGERK